MSSKHAADEVASQLAGHLGITIADARRGRRWTLRELAERAGISPSMLHAVEHGAVASLATYAAIGKALGLEVRLDLIDPRRRVASARAEDPVHAAMGEVLAASLAGHGRVIAIDEPYQHFQFAGRADLLAWDLDRRSLLHVENRTRLPNLQEAIGSYNAKRRYLPAVMADRLGLRGGFASVTNVMACLWSSEVLHAVRIRAATFRSVCPDGAADLATWLSGSVPAAGSSTSSFILVDPTTGTGSRARMFVDLDTAFDPSTRPRFRGYADAVERLTRTERA